MPQLESSGRSQWGRSAGATAALGGVNEDVMTEEGSASAAGIKNRRQHQQQHARTVEAELQRSLAMGVPAAELQQWVRSALARDGGGSVKGGRQRRHHSHNDAKVVGVTTEPIGVISVHRSAVSTTDTVRNSENVSYSRRFESVAVPSLGALLTLVRDLTALEEGRDGDEEGNDGGRDAALSVSRKAAKLSFATVGPDGRRIVAGAGVAAENHQNKVTIDVSVRHEGTASMEGATSSPTASISVDLTAVDEAARAAADFVALQRRKERALRALLRGAKVAAAAAAAESDTLRRAVNSHCEEKEALAAENAALTKALAESRAQYERLAYETVLSTRFSGGVASPSSNYPFLKPPPPPNGAEKEGKAALLPLHQNVPRGEQSLRLLAAVQRALKEMEEAEAEEEEEEAEVGGGEGDRHDDEMANGMKGEESGVRRTISEEGATSSPISAAGADYPAGVPPLPSPLATTRADSSLSQSNSHMAISTTTVKLMGGTDEGGVNRRRRGSTATVLFGGVGAEPNTLSSSPVAAAVSLATVSGSGRSLIPSLFPPIAGARSVRSPAKPPSGGGSLHPQSGAALPPLVVPSYCSGNGGAFSVALIGRTHSRTVRNHHQPTANHTSPDHRQQHQQQKLHAAATAALERRTDDLSRSNKSLRARCDEALRQNKALQTAALTHHDALSRERGRADGLAAALASAIADTDARLADRARAVDALERRVVPALRSGQQQLEAYVAELESALRGAEARRAADCAALEAGVAAAEDRALAAEADRDAWELRATRQSVAAAAIPRSRPLFVVTRAEEVGRGGEEATADSAVKCTHPQQHQHTLTSTTAQRGRLARARRALHEPQQAVEEGGGTRAVGGVVSCPHQLPAGADSVQRGGEENGGDSAHEVQWESLLSSLAGDVRRQQAAAALVTGVGPSRRRRAR